MASSKTYEMGFALQARVDGQFGTAFKNAGNSISAVGKEIQSLNKTGQNITAFEKTQRAIELTERRLQSYKTQLANLSAEYEANGNHTAAAENALEKLSLKVDEAQMKVDEEKQKLSDLGTTLEKSGVDTSNLGNEKAKLADKISQASASMAREAEQAVQASSSVEELGEANKGAMESLEDLIAAAGLMTALKKGYDLLSSCTDAAIKFESSMAAVKRTVGGDDTFLSSLGESFKDLSTQIPITQSELAGIATTAGQLGVARDQVQSFTVTMAQLATTTDLSADSAATMAAQFANITGVDDYERFGSVIAELGDATATTASKVLEMGQGMAASASQAGMSAQDILAIAAAVGSLGIEAASGSTSMSTLISTLNKSVETGDKLQEFASVAGMSADQFRQAWGQDAVSAMDAFIQGLNDVERNGKSATVVLDELGITNVRQVKAILGLASAGDLLSNTIQQSNQAWTQNTALTQKASVMYNTTESKITMMQNAVSNLQIAVGDALTPVLSAGAEALTNLIDPIADFIEQNPAIVQGLATIAAGLGSVVAGVSVLTVASKAATAAVGLLGGAFGPILAVSAGLAAVAGIVVGISAAIDAANPSFDEATERIAALNDKIAEQNSIQDAIQRYRDLKNEIADLNEGNKVITLTAEILDSDKLDGNAFMSDTKVTGLTPEQWDTLQAMDFLDGDAKIWLEPDSEQRKALKAAGFFFDEDNPVIELTPDVQEALKLDPQACLQDGSAYLTLSPDQTQKLYAEDFFTADQLENGAITAKISGEAIESLTADGFLVNGDSSIEFTATLNTDQINDIEMQRVLDLQSAAKDSKQAVIEFLITKGAKSVSDDDIAEIEKLYAMAQETKTPLYGYINENIDIKGLAQLSGESVKTLGALIDEVQRTDGELSSELKLVGYENVDQMQAAYEIQSQMPDVMDASATKAEELAAKTAELAEVQNMLRDASGGLITATNDQTEAYQQQLDAYAKIVELQQIETRANIQEAIRSQAKAYAAAVNQEAQATSNYNNAVASTVSVIDTIGSTTADAKAQLQGYFDAMQEAYDQDFSEIIDIDSYEKAFEQFKELARVASGGEIEIFNETQAWEFLSNVDRYVNSENLTKGWKNANQEVEAYRQQILDAQKIQDDFISNIAQGITSGALTEAQAEEMLGEAYAYQADSAAQVEAIMEQVREKIEEVKSAEEGMGEGVDSGSSAIESAVSGVILALQDLQNAYDEAYNAAYKAISGQFGLFDEYDVSKKTETSIEKMQKALESQLQYMNTYASNLEELQQLVNSGTISADFAAQFTDGSQESAAYLQTIIDASRQDASQVKALDEAYQNLESGKQNFATQAAQVQTQLESSIDNIIGQLETAAQEMDISSEAADAGAAAIAAFAEAAKGNYSLIDQAFSGAASRAAALLSTAAANAGAGLNEYASGTTSAEPGLAIVGENGPELMALQGGEQIINADRTADILERDTLNAQHVNAIPSETSGSANYNIELQPTFNITAENQSSDELQATMQNVVGDLREMIEDTLKDIENDSKRRRYSA